MNFAAIAVSSLLAASALADDSQLKALESLATKTGKTANAAHDWAKHGAFVFRVCTPDNPNVLPEIEQGLALTNHLLDGSIHQIPIINGLIGHDHLGVCNWDGLWPYWGRVTFRAGDWKSLHDFMRRVKDRDNAAVSFHLNITDVNAGLRDYPESAAFFQKLVAARAIYRRDQNSITHLRGTELPYVLQRIPDNAREARDIIAHVDYKKFWDSGLAKGMIDDFYGRLPYSPPILYLDVLTLSDNSSGMGLPNGPLGGSEKTQLEGVLAIANYLHGKGTDLATEGDRHFLGSLAGYGWLHCNPGYSSDDYSYIAGAARYIPVQQVAGDTGCFNVSVMASTAGGLAQVRDHYAKLLAGAPDPKRMSGPETYHFCRRDPDVHDEFDIPGANNDPFRGDWADLVDNFYLTGIQELYHIGKGNVRTDVFNKWGVLWIARFGLVDPAGKEISIAAADCAPAELAEAVKKTGEFMIMQPLAVHFNAPQAGKYRVILYGAIHGNDHGALNIYVNGQLRQTALDVHFPSRDIREQPFPLGEITLNAGDNALAFDAGPIYMRWSDGTTALWTTPYLGKGFKVTDGDLTFADDYDRMWPDTWSGQKKIYFFSWDGAGRTWKLPADWASVRKAILYPLTPDGRGPGTPLTITQGTVTPKLSPRRPFILVPASDE